MATVATTPSSRESLGHPADASPLEPVLSTADVLEEEYAALHPDEALPQAASFGAYDIATIENRRLASVYARMHAKQHAALCLSGGGIRSASFAMGVVQALAQRGLLRGFDYLSTVSGGGYTGSWLSAWMSRSGAERVHAELSAPSRGIGSSVEPTPIRHIRTYSYYLTPSFGLFSADTWTLLATIARNVFLIWFVTLPLMAAALMLPRLFVAWPMTTLHDWNTIGLDPADVMVALIAVGTVLAISAIAFVQRHLYTYNGRQDSEDTKDAATVQQFLTRCLAPLVIAMTLLAQGWEMVWSMVRFSPEELRTLSMPLSHRGWTNALVAIDPHGHEAEAAAVVAGVVFWTFVYLTAWLISARGRPHRLHAALLSAFSGALAGAIGGFCSARLFGLIEWRHPPEFYATLAVPVSLWGLLVSKQLVVGLASRQMTDAERESNARFSAWLLITIAAWIGIVGLALYGPMFLRHAVGESSRLAGLISLSGITGLVVSVLASSSRLSAQKTRKGAAGDTGSASTIVQRLAIGLATPLFAVTVIVLVSLLDGAVLGGACNLVAVWCPPDEPSGLADLFRAHPASITTADYATPHLVVLVMAALLLLGYTLGRLIDTNRFSLHAMYRVRLVRTFLGASKRADERHPNPFTGFDETDDVPMGALWPATHATAPDATVHPPLHVVNITLNTVADSKLATQNRMASSFTVTSLHAGTAGVGYRRTSVKDDVRQHLYGGPSGVSLGTAMAISGAAASPNAGYHSSPAVTFLMTLFNARLGWWLGNPGRAGHRSFADDEPRLAVLPIIEEMFGRTTDKSPYVYLSDGGHFENLGLYEMVRRRCRFIVVSDAGCDPDGVFDDLGGAIRKIRIDFGIPIEFEAGIPVYPRSAPNRPPDAQYWAVARILYTRVDGETAEDGVLLYIKPAFYGREPADVYNYGSSTPDFPHEATSNQFFGEAQFESYRALGVYAVNQLCDHELGVPADSDGTVQAAQLEAWLRAKSTGEPVVSDPLAKT